MSILSAIQPSFLPWRGYFDIIKKSDYFIFYDHVQYDKNGWRNRNKILINNKPNWITIPIKNLKLDKKIKDVEIFNSKKSLDKVYRTIYFNYKNSPNFKSTIEIIENTFKKKWTYLSELNIELTIKLCKKLNITNEFRLSSEIKNIDDKNENLINLCKKFNCNKYLSGPAAKAYIDLEAFKKSNIEVIWHNYVEKPYIQYNSNDFFFEKLSIIDYMFNKK